MLLLKDDELINIDKVHKIEKKIVKIPGSHTLFLIIFNFDFKDGQNCLATESFRYKTQESMDTAFDRIISSLALELKFMNLNEDLLNG